MTGGAAREGTLAFSLVPDCHRQVLSRLLAEAEAAALVACDPADLRLVVEEVLTNVVKYSGAAEANAEGRVHWRMEPRRLDLVFEDPGRPFDPLAVDEEGLDDEERCDGGMGILLVRSLADAIGYHRSDGRNRLELTFTSAGGDPAGN